MEGTPQPAEHRLPQAVEGCVDVNGGGGTRSPAQATLSDRVAVARTHPRTHTTPATQRSNARDPTRRSAEQILGIAARSSGRATHVTTPSLSTPVVVPPTSVSGPLSGPPHPRVGGSARRASRATSARGSTRADASSGNTSRCVEWRAKAVLALSADACISYICCGFKSSWTLTRFCLCRLRNVSPQRRTHAPTRCRRVC
jgi:hypothetical protein